MMLAEEDTTIAHYPRQAHTRIYVTTATAEGQYEGKNTEMKLHHTLGGMFLEINLFKDADSTEPHTHELVFGVASVRVEAVEDAAPVEAPVEPDGDLVTVDPEAFARP